MADEKSVSEKLDAFFDSFNKRMDAADEERKADRARLDATCSRMDSYDEERKADRARKDAAEKEEKEKGEKAKADAARKDAEEKEKADKARKDAEEKEREEKARADAAARSAIDPTLAARLAEIEKRLPAHLSAEELPRFIEAQGKAERVYQAFGDSAPRWLNGDSLPEYQRRLLSKYKSYSADWKDRDLAKLDQQYLDIAETKIYADAYYAATHPTDLPPGTSRKIERQDTAGRKVTEFVGADDACWGQFAYHPGAVRVLRRDGFNTRANRAN